MNAGMFFASRNQAFQFLKNIKLSSDVQENVAYPKGMPGIMRGLPYHEIWKKCFKDRLYNVCLSDQSLLIFRNDPEVSFSFLHCPYEMPTFDSMESHELGYAYEQFIETLIEHKPHLPVRYDYSPSSYRSARHPASHIHFGEGTAVRVSSKKIMTPLAFSYFIVRQFFPEYWEIYLSNKNLAHVARVVRDNLESIDNKYFNDLDSCEVFLQ
jgi:hypothetical protein